MLVRLSAGGVPCALPRVEYFADFLLSIGPALESRLLRAFFARRCDVRPLFGGTPLGRFHGGTSSRRCRRWLRGWTRGWRRGAPRRLGCSLLFRVGRIFDVDRGR